MKRILSPANHVFAIGCALALSMASASVFAGWFGDTVKGNGTLRTEERKVTGFTGVELSLPAQVEVRTGTAESVKIEADDNLLPLIESRVQNGALKLRANKRNLELDGKIRITVTARRIDNLQVGGSGSITAQSIQSNKLALAIGGSGSIDVKQLQADTVDAHIGGSGDLKLAGGAKTLDVAIGGSGDVDAGQLKTENVQVSIGGSGQATVWPVATLSASIAGSGDVRYYGDPSTSLSVVGSGRTKRLGASPVANAK